ncbi:MAG: hypothetical protein H7Z77_01100 [Chitinophagaceae bacterium]|nr:hypothetical protein [Polaromonas sp.]
MLQKPAADVNCQPRVLLAWEHGRNMGHLARLLVIANWLERSGFEPVWAVPQAMINAPALVNVGHVRLPAPVMMKVQQHAGHPPSALDATAERQAIHSYADILLSFGFGQPEALQPALSAWCQLIHHVQPHCIVLDYAPAAQLSAQLLGLPAFQITNGFDAPPPSCPVFNITMRGPYLDRLNDQKLEQIATSIHTASQQLLAVPGPTLAEYFVYPTKVYDCIPETDPYAPRSDGLYLGPLTGTSTDAAPGASTSKPATPPLQPAPTTETNALPWPADPPHMQDLQHPQRPHIFAYLRHQSGAADVLQALQRANASTLCVWPDATDAFLQQSQTPHLHMQRQPVDLQRALQQADVVVSYGATTTSCLALLAGKPQLLIPADIEKHRTSQRIQALGAGLLWSSSQPARHPASSSAASCLNTLNQLLYTPSYKTAAQAVAASYPPAMLQDKRT